MDNTQNFVSGQIVTAPSPATSGTSLTVSNGSYFPDPATFGAYNLCVWSQAGDPSPANCEIVRVTAKLTSGNNASLTVTRAQEGTTALALAVGWKAYYSITAKMFGEIASSLTNLQTGKQDVLNFDSTPVTGSNNPVTSDGIADALSEKQDALNFDTSPRSGSSNPVTSAGIFGAIQSVQADVDSKQDELTFDQVPTNNSTNPATSGGIFTALAAKQNVLTFDGPPTEDSTNPVTSAGVYTALLGKQGTLIWDSTPISGSLNPVTSGGIFAALASKGSGTITSVKANGTTVATSGEANIPAASTNAYGVTQLTDSTSSTSTTTAATPNSVKTAYDLAASKGTGTITAVQANGTSVATSGTANIPAATTAVYGVTQLTDSTSSTSTTTAATPNSVKTAYDLAASKTDNTGTITEVQANGTSIATSGVANIPTATTARYGVTELSSSTSSSSTTLAATASAVKAAYDIHNTTFTNATVSTTTKSQTIAATSSCRFNYTQSAASCTYTFSPAAAGYVWTVKITKSSGNKVAFNSNITMMSGATVENAWTEVVLVFLAVTTSNILGFVAGYQE